MRTPATAAMSRRSRDLLWRLDSRFDSPDGIFHTHEHIELQDLFRPGRCTILQLSDIEQHEQQVIVGTLLRRANKARMMTVRSEATTGENFLNYPVFTLLEEAHRFAPAGASVVSTNILKQILSEGRKFGVGIGLITQRPGKLDQDVLSQCMTQIIMRIVNPIDQDTVAKSVEGAGRAMLAELPALTKGPSGDLGRRDQYAGDVPDPPANDKTRRRNLRRALRMDEMALLRRDIQTRTGQRALFKAELGQEAGEGGRYSDLTCELPKTGRAFGFGFFRIDSILRGGFSRLSAPCAAHSHVVYGVIRFAANDAPVLTSVRKRRVPVCERMLKRENSSV